MAENTRVSGQRTSRLKLALILVLALVFAILLSRGDDGKESNTTEIETGESITSKSATSHGAAANKNSDVFATTAGRAVTEWPEMPLEEILSHDPFAFRAASDGRSGTKHEPAAEEIARQVYEKRRAERIEKLTTDLQNERVSIVFRSEKGTTAFVGSRLVQVGDLWEDGVRVIEIRPGGVTLEVEDQ